MAFLFSELVDFGYVVIPDRRTSNRARVRLGLFFSELVDFGAYTPLARRRFYTALIASVAVGAVADEIVLRLAFGSLDHLAGQIIGKVYAVAAYAGFQHIRTKKSRPARGGFEAD